MVKGVIRVLTHPHDLWLLLHIGASIVLTPGWVARADLRNPRSLRTSALKLPLPRADGEQIEWIRSWWLRRAPLRRFNTCYVRAIVLYRFLRGDDDAIQLHFGIETREQLHERLRGHAWVTLNGVALEAPPPVQEGRIREIEL
jgi:hypothetical protein